jgi:carboxypeptidase family protein
LPGRFRITVYDQLGNALFSDLHVELSDPAQPYPIVLDLFWVKGTVYLGDEPVAGRLFFGQRGGTVSTRMTSDENGRFEGPLSRPGSWRVDVEGDEPRLKARAMVEVKPKGGRATVSIKLPDTVVSGRVVDSEGKPVPGADITLSSLEGGAMLAGTDDKGEFELRYFPQGLNELSASKSVGSGEREVSDPHLFDAVENQPHGPVLLTLRRNRVLRGRILAATGPVIGATVRAWPTMGGEGLIQTARSRLDGDFELKMPVGTQVLRAIVSPPGGALKIHEVNVASDAELLFQVEPLGGELVVTLGNGQTPDKEVFMLWQEDLGVPLGLLKEWAEGHGGRFWQEGQVRIPQLAPGSYTVCAGSPVVEVSRDSEAWKSRARCKTGYLAAGSSLELRFE